MIIIGLDYHPSFQQIACVDTETGDYGEQRLGHRKEAETFYWDLARQGKKVLMLRQIEVVRLILRLVEKGSSMDEEPVLLDRCGPLYYGACLNRLRFRFGLQLGPWLPQRKCSS